MGWRYDRVRIRPRTKSKTPGGSPAVQEAILHRRLNSVAFCTAGLPPGVFDFRALQIWRGMSDTP